MIAIFDIMVSQVHYCKTFRSHFTVKWVGLMNNPPCPLILFFFFILFFITSITMRPCLHYLFHQSDSPRCWHYKVIKPDKRLRCAPDKTHTLNIPLSVKISKANECSAGNNKRSEIFSVCLNCMSMLFTKKPSDICHKHMNTFYYSTGYSVAFQNCYTHLRIWTDNIEFQLQGCRGTDVW